MLEPPARDARGSASGSGKGGDGGGGERFGDPDPDGGDPNPEPGSGPERPLARASPGAGATCAAEVAERRVRLALGLKRYFHHKRLEGLLSNKARGGRFCVRCRRIVGTI